MAITSDDVCELLNISDWKEADDEFLETWLGCEIDEQGVLTMPEKEPPGRDEEAQFCMLACIMHTFGVPMKQVSGSRVDTIHFRKEFKLPKRVYHRIAVDKSFEGHMVVTLYQAQKLRMLAELQETGYDKCTSCGKNQAVGFVNSMSCNLNNNAFNRISFISYPVCKEMACNVALRKERDALANRASSDSPSNKLTGRELCGNCQTFESSLGKMKCCARCKSIYYCNKECQKEDWSRHKKECKKFIEQTKNS